MKRSGKEVAAALEHIVECYEFSVKGGAVPVSEKKASDSLFLASLTCVLEFVAECEDEINGLQCQLTSTQILARSALIRLLPMTTWSHDQSYCNAIGPYPEQCCCHIDPIKNAVHDLKRINGIGAVDV